MTDWIQIALACVMPFLGGLAACTFGAYTERTKPKPKPVADPQPVCGCGHHASYHDEKGGCHHQQRPQYDNGWRECGCVKYVGPEPLPSFYDGGLS